MKSEAKLEAEIETGWVNLTNIHTQHKKGFGDFHRGRGPPIRSRSPAFLRVLKIGLDLVAEDGCYFFNGFW